MTQMKGKKKKKKKENGLSHHGRETTGICMIRGLFPGARLVWAVLGSCWGAASRNLRACARIEWSLMASGLAGSDGESIVMLVC